MRRTKKHSITFILIPIFLCASLVARQKKVSELSTRHLLDSNQETELTKSIRRGKEIYTDFCMQCHLPNGQGTPKVFPPLAGSDWLTSKREKSIYSIKYGLNGLIKVNGLTYNSVMSPMGLEDEEIADVMNYIMNSWNNTQKQMVTPKEVAAIKK